MDVPRSPAADRRTDQADAPSIRCASSTWIRVGSVDRRRQEPAHHLVELRLPELVRQLLDLRRHGHVHVEWDRDQRQPRHERRVASPRSSRAAAEHRLVVGLPIHPEQLSQQRAPDDVWAGGCERLGRRQQDFRFLFRVELLDQPALADPGFADELDQPTVASPPRLRARLAARRAPCRVRSGELHARVAGARPDHFAHRPRLHGLRLALDHERLELVGREPGARRLEDLARSRRSVRGWPSPSAGRRGSPHRP